MYCLLWQHDGNEKSNSPYFMDNTDNINPTSENTKAKLFKLCFSGASGSEAKWLLSSPKNLDITRVFGSRNLKKIDENDSLIPN